MIHDWIEDAPCGVKYCPGQQRIQSSGDDMPSPDEYDPAVNAAHVLESTAPNAVEYRPDMHSKHPLADDSPDPDAYVPATHATQAADSMALL
jgi:hypothetical protein